MKISLMHSQVLQHRQQLLSALTCPAHPESGKLLEMGNSMNSTQELIFPNWGQGVNPTKWRTSTDPKKGV